MYTLDFVSSITDLKEREIRELELKNFVKPVKKGNFKYYSFQDIYICKITWILKREGIKLEKIGKTFNFLKELKPDKPLSAFTLLTNGKEILDFTDNPKIIASRYGQVVDGGLIKDTVKMISIGSELDCTRKNILSFDLALQKRLKTLRANRKNLKVAKTAGDLLCVWVCFKLW